MLLPTSAVRRHGSGYYFRLSELRAILRNMGIIFSSQRSLIEAFSFGDSKLCIFENHVQKKELPGHAWRFEHLFDIFVDIRWAAQVRRYAKFRINNVDEIFQEDFVLEPFILGIISVDGDDESAVYRITRQN